MATVCIIDHVTDRVFLSVHGIQSNVTVDKILRTKRPKVKTHLASMEVFLSWILFCYLYFVYVMLSCLFVAAF